MKYTTRKNPYVDVNNQGYLYNPQYANEWVIGRDRYYSIDRDKVVLWVHATEYEGTGDWLNKTLDQIANTKVFYVGGGANAFHFGSNYVFVKYKPTKIFSGDTYFDGYNPKEAEQFLDCLVSKFNPNELDAEIIEQYNYIYEGDLNFSELDKYEIKSLLRKSLETMFFSFFENRYVQECLLQFGFTAYFEKEHIYDSYTWEEVNLAILEPDFDKVEIVGILSPTKKINNIIYYKCPRCGDDCGLNEILDSTFEKGEIMCKGCRTTVLCNICDNWTKESDFAEIEEDSWGDVISIICTTCEKDRKCEFCEDYYNEDELIKFKFEGDYWDSIYCQGCYDSEVED